MQYDFRDEQDELVITQDFPGRDFHLALILGLFIVLPNCFLLLFAALFWPAGVIAVMAFSLTALALKHVPKQKRTVRVDKRTGKLTVTEQRPGADPQTVLSLEFSKLVSVGTYGRPVRVRRPGGQTPQRAYAYAPVFLTEDGTLIDSLVPGPSHVRPGEEVPLDVETVNRDVEKIAAFLGVPAVTVYEKQSVVVTGESPYRLKPFPVALKHRLEQPGYKIAFITFILLFVFSTLGFHEAQRQNKARERARDTIFGRKRAASNELKRAEPSQPPPPQPAKPAEPLPTPPTWLITRSYYSEGETLTGREKPSWLYNKNSNEVRPNKGLRQHTSDPTLINLLKEAERLLSQRYAQDYLYETYVYPPPVPSDQSDEYVLYVALSEEHTAEEKKALKTSLLDGLQLKEGQLKMVFPPAPGGTEDWQLGVIEGE